MGTWIFRPSKTLLYDSVSLGMRTSSLECSSLCAPYSSNYYSPKTLTVCSPVILLLHQNAQVKRLRPQVTTRQLQTYADRG